MTNEIDMIRRGDAMTILSNGSQTWGEAVAAIAALPAVAASQPADPVTNADSRQRVTVKPLVFDDLGIASDDLLNVIIVYRNPADQDRHNAERAARILAAIDVPTDHRDAQIAVLVDALTDTAAILQAAMNSGKVRGGNQYRISGVYLQIVSDTLDVAAAALAALIGGDA